MMAPDNADDRGLDALATLLRLLAEHGRGAAMYGSGFSMHLPMVLVALFRMGATPARLETIAAAKMPAAEARAAVIQPIKGDDWEQQLGKQGTFMPFRVYFADELARTELDAVLARFLPRLLEGMAAAGFHAVIRLSYGLDLGSRGLAEDPLAPGQGRDPQDRGAV